MFTSTALATLLVAAQAASAFKGTYPVVAWSSESLDSFSSLSPSSPPPAKGARSSSSQTTFSSSTTDDLCSLSTLLVLSAPGLHYSDLSLLPSSASSPAGVKASLAHFGASDVAGSTVTHPYVSHRQKSKPAGLIRRFVKECGATVQAGDDQVWHGGEEKSVRIVNLKGLDEWELTGREAREGRKEVMSEIDSAVSNLGTNLPRPFAVVLTTVPSFSLPSSSLKIGHVATKLSKRQADSTAEDEYVEELLEEIAKEDALDDMMEKMTEFEEGASAFTGSESEDESAPVADAEYAADSADLGVTDPSSAETLEQEEALAYDDNAEGYTWDGSSILEVSPTFQKNGTGNGTSIFQPKAGSGLFHRYVFFTPAIIFSFLVTLLVLVPTLILGTSSLLSIETVHGLETKMTGTVGLDASKA